MVPDPKKTLHCGKMKLIKRFSSSAFELLKNGNVRIGSLTYYKAIEDESRKDEMEGIRPVFIQGGDRDSNIVSAQRFNELSSFVGCVSKINNPELKLKIRGSGKFIINSDHNIFVFCCSQQSEYEKTLDHKFGCKIIQINDPKLFSLMIANKLHEEIIVNQKIELMGDADGISFGHHEIIYKNKESMDSTEVSSFNENVFNISDVFIKDESFKEENEYRFIWFPFYSPTNRMCSLPIGFKFIDIYLPEIWNTIEEITK